MQLVGSSAFAFVEFGREMSVLFVFFLFRSSQIFVLTYC